MAWWFKVWKIEYTDPTQDNPFQTVHVAAKNEAMATRYFSDVYGKENASRIKSVAAVIEKCHVC